MNVMPNARSTQRATLAGSTEQLPAPRSTMYAWAGIVGPLLFTAGFVVQEAFRRDDYSPVADPVSALEAGPNGWIQQVNFVVFGLLTLALAVGLHRGLRRIRGGLAGPALLGVSGVGLLLAAVFPLQQDAMGEVYDPGGHAVAGTMFFATSAIALVVLSRRLAGDPRWRAIAGYVLVAGVLAVIGFVVMGRLVIPDGAPLHEWAGLAQRALILLVLFPARIVLGLRLLQVTRAAERSTHDPMAA
jgi:hypothetical membrane protein